MNGAIGSTNRLKYSAAVRALEVIAKNTRLDVLFVKSAVNKQPIGPEETYIGARYRADMTYAQLPGSDFVLGSENGIRRRTADGKWEDWAVGVALFSNKTIRIVNSAAVIVPTEIIEELMRRGPNNVTCGMILAERYGCNPEDPHSYLTDGATSREQLLFEMFLKLKGNF